MKYLDIEVITRLDLSKLAQGTLTKYWLHIISSGIAQPVYLPIMVAKGATGMTVGDIQGKSRKELSIENR